MITTHFLRNDKISNRLFSLKHLKLISKLWQMKLHEKKKTISKMVYFLRWGQIVFLWKRTSWCKFIHNQFNFMCCTKISTILHFYFFSCNILYKTCQSFQKMSRQPFRYPRRIYPQQMPNILSNNIKIKYIESLEELELIH